MPPALHLLFRSSLPTLNPNPNTRITIASAYSSSPLESRRPLRYAVLGAGFAGLSVAWHLLKHGPMEPHICLDIYDENGIAGGASGISGGLLHPYSPKAKLLWRGADFWKECLELFYNAEWGNKALGESRTNEDETFIWRRGILRPATTEKNVEILLENARSCLQSCNLEVLDANAAQCLIPGLRVPFNFAVHMPLALNVNPKKYLQALFFSCLNLADQASLSKEVNLYKQHIDNLQQLAGAYDSVIICLGAKAGSLPELSEKLPLRSCRGVIAEFQLPTDAAEPYGNQSPSILSDAWLAFQGPRSVSLGSTWEWKSKNYDSAVSAEESLTAMQELLPKASAVYPGISKWEFIKARAGLRAMPPLTPNGSLPLLGCLNDMIGETSNCTFWLVGGLGARGLLYHGLAGKLTAEAVISSDESVIPPEFTCWKRMKNTQ